MKIYRMKSYKKGGRLEFVPFVSPSLCGALYEAHFCVQEYQDIEKIDLYYGDKIIATLYK